MSWRQRVGRSLLVASLLGSVVAPLRAGVAEAATLPANFQEQIVFTGLSEPTNIGFSPDGRIFVAEKRGTVTPGNNAPTAVIDSPATSLTWAVGDPITFSGHATDPQQGTLPASALHWRLRLRHCDAAGNCHNHFLQEWAGVASGSFTAPDHEYPSHLELELTATDAQGLTHSVVNRLDPKTVTLTFATDPPGLQLTAGSSTQTAPFTRTAIQGSSTTISAPTPQTSGPTTYTFDGWSDGGAQTHVITAPATASYTASYTGTTPPCADSFGYTCTTGSQAFVSAGNVLALTGDVAAMQLGLPFVFPFYGQSYSSVWVSTKGLLSFAGEPGPYVWLNGSLPATGVPNGTVAAFWDDLVVDGSASVRTQVFGAAPQRFLVVEWRNVYVWPNTSDRVTFEIAVYENGDLVFNYAGLDNAAQRGASATVGIENAAGTVGLQYSFNTAALTTGVSLRFRPRRDEGGFWAASGRSGAEATVKRPESGGTCDAGDVRRAVVGLLPRCGPVLRSSGRG